MSAAETSLANEEVCLGFQEQKQNTFSVFVSVDFLHLVTFPVLQHLLSSYTAFIRSS